METIGLTMLEIMIFVVGTFIGTPLNVNALPPTSDLSSASTPRIEEEVAAPEYAGGSFESVAGVMDPLSCACNDGGYITDETGEYIPVCLDDSQSESTGEELESCQYVSVSGSYTEYAGSTDSNSPCPRTGMTYLAADHAVCEF